MRLVNLNNATSLSADVFNLAATLGIAGFAARLAREIHLPAPYISWEAFWAFGSPAGLLQASWQRR
ncbi:MAG: hypothetical protein OXE98_02715 [Hyphomicrobiales bacterium]|nr:hypothetical protein [Hyphomicrobiales bacterium]